MHSILVHAHSGLRWILLILILAAIFSTISGLSGNKPFTATIRKTALFTLIVTHLQLILGLILYFISPKVQFGPDTMSDSVLRFFAVEHISTMLIAIVLITLGYSRMKRGSSDGAKYKAVFWFYLFGFILLMAGMPWPFRGLGGWF